jgi:hypothetical protein
MHAFQKQSRRPSSAGHRPWENKLAEQRQAQSFGEQVSLQPQAHAFGKRVGPAVPCCGPLENKSAQQRQEQTFVNHSFWQHPA